MTANTCAKKWIYTQYKNMQDMTTADNESYTFFLGTRKYLAKKWIYTQYKNIHDIARADNIVHESYSCLSMHRTKKGVSLLIDKVIQEGV